MKSQKILLRKVNLMRRKSLEKKGRAVDDDNTCDIENSKVNVEIKEKERRFIDNQLTL